MSRRRLPAEPAADYGAQPWRVAVEDAPDPDRPNATIRRARAYDPLRRMDLDPPLFNAAERFRACWQRMNGGRDSINHDRVVVDNGSSAPWVRCHYQHAAFMARQEVELSLVAVGARLAGVFNLAVIWPIDEADDPEPMTIRRIERILRIRNGAGSDLITEALERLLAWQTESGR